MKQNNKPTYVSTEFVVSMVLLAAAVLATLFLDKLYFRWLGVVIVFLAAFAYYFTTNWRRQRMVMTAGLIYAKAAGQIDKYVNATAIPSALTSPGGRIVWHNPAFLLLAGRQCEGRNIYKVFPGLDKPDKNKKIKIGDKVFFREMIHNELDGKEYVLYRFVDVENALESADLCRVVLPTVCHIQIDNYGDLRRGLEQNIHFEVESDIQRILARMAKEIHALYQRYDRDKYIVVFERRFMSTLVQNKFAVLDDIRKLDTGNAALRPTLSLGIGLAANTDEANQNALKALEMALGRGGDQAVSRDVDGFKFYGGIQQGREKRTRVKSRMFANALRNLMEQCDRVIVMGHNVPDLDSIGAALGVYACARRINKKAYVVMDRPNVSIEALVDELRSDPDYKGILVTPAEAEAMLDAKTMLVIVDTQIQQFTIDPRLVEIARTVVVIDHHVRGANYIKDPTLMLHEPYASSASEMVTELIQYFSDNIVLKPLEVEALLAGITIDTKGYSYKTGVRTFEAAGWLRRMGADTTKIKHLFKDDLRTYKARAKVVESAEVVEGIAVAVCPPEIENPQLLTAQAADELVGIRGIDASFVLCEEGGAVIISGRSLGDTNVQRILEKLGGGGHATIAGAQLRNITVGEALEQLKGAIREYKREVN